MWLLLWLLFVFVLLMLPLGYGWAYRGWGPPYPGYFRRRRAPADPVGYEPVDSWGLAGDLLWVALIVAVAWFVIAVLA